MIVRPRPVLLRQQKGFTILELMIATIVFAVILLVVTFGILQISRTYYKGVNETNTQTVARSIMDTIGQSIQFTGSSVNLTKIDTDHVFCIGEQKYTFRPGWVVVKQNPVSSQHETYYGLYVKDGVHYCSPDTDPVDLAVSTPTLIGGRELLSPNMRIAKLSIKQDPSDINQFQITIRIIYGQDDFIYSPTNPTGNHADASDATCKGSASGSPDKNAGTVQFCSVSELSTTVTKRVKSN